MNHFEWLRAQCTRDPRLAVFIDQITEGADKALAAERAGYSGGKNPDPKIKRKRYQTTASSILNKPRVRLLMEAYRLRKQRGEQTDVASREERRQVLSEIARSASPNERKGAVAELNKMDDADLSRRGDGTHVKAGARARIEQRIALHGENEVAHALGVLGMENLSYWPAVFEARLAKLERRHVETGDDDDGRTEPAGPTARFPRGHAGGADDGGTSATRGNAPRKMGKRAPAAGSAAGDRGRGERRDDAIRDADGSVITPRELATRQKEIFGL